MKERVHRTYLLLAAIRGKAVAKLRTGTKEEKAFATEIIDMIAQPFEVFAAEAEAAEAEAIPRESPPPGNDSLGVA